jgi:hypothetical protein
VSKMTNKQLEQQNEYLRKMLDQLEKSNKSSVIEVRPRPVRSGPDCFFCGGTHFVDQCEDMQDYIKKGLITKIDGKWRLPNGKGIPGDLGQRWKKRLDDHYAEQNGHTNMITAIMFQGIEDDEADWRSAPAMHSELSSLRGQLESLQQHLENAKEKGF